MNPTIRLTLHYFGVILGILLFSFSVCGICWVTTIPLMAEWNIPFLSAPSKFFLAIGFGRYYVLCLIVWLLAALWVDDYNKKQLAKRVEENLTEEL